MDIAIKRIYKGAEYTVGRLSIDGKYFCDTLEDAVRAPGVKVRGKTAVPEGRYRVVLTESPRFKRILPLLVDVPNFEGVRIHPGNTAKDTEGCLLVGFNQVKGKVVSSRATFQKLFEKLWAADQAGEEIWTEIK
ncbi:DUF5675 family protein [Candidatus Avelusimicrobium alvi]|uniref:DUF5675 family protein n=1 Tax=Candidatus Avelusimicrobium alvi TaxID=3416221 RepID=UPI003D0A3F29